MHYTVAPSMSQVSKLPRVAQPVTLQARTTHHGVAGQMENMPNYVPLGSATLIRAPPSAPLQGLGQSQFPAWLAIPGIAAVFGWLMGRSFAQNQKVEAHQPISCCAMATASAQKTTFPMKGNGLTKPLQQRTFPSMHQRQRVRANYEEKQPVFMKKLNETFPGAMLETTLVAKATKVMNSYGFNKENSIPLISVCRDEITRTLVEDFEELWGLSFSSGSLAGMAFLGKTGMGAGMAHAPQTDDGVERYIFVCAPHVAISETGEVGKCVRVGRENIGSACGALIAMQSELAGGKIGVATNTMDMELTMMKQQLSELIPYGKVPSLEDLTKTAQKCIQNQLESILSGMSGNLTGRTEYCFLSGVQIHGPDNADFFWPADMYYVKLDGTKVNIDLEDVRKADASDLLGEIALADTAKAMFVVQQGDLPMVKRWISENGGDVNAVSSEGKTAIKVAARFGHYDIVKYLLDQGANPDIRSNRGRGALQESVVHGHTEIAEILKNAGCALDVEVAQFYLWRACREGDLALIKRIIRFGPDELINMKDENGDSPLFAAVRLNNIEVAQWLIANGASTKGTDMDGNTLLSMASRRGFKDLERVLQQAFGGQDNADVMKELQDAQEEMVKLQKKFLEMQKELIELRNNM